MSKEKAAVVILNFNGKKFLEKFLPGVIAQSEAYQIVVADNASTDDSLSFLKNEYPQVKVLSTGGNFGYAEGYNRALKEVQAEYFILLNSDVEVTPKWIAPILKIMDADPAIAACQPKILDFSQPDKYEYAGAAGGFIDKYGYPFCRGRIFDHLEKDYGQYNGNLEVFWATGACLFVRASAFQQVGGFDGDYFAHMEEIDLCWRLKNLGYKIMAVPESVVYHVGGGTLNKVSSRKTFLNFRNNLTTLAKNHSPRFLFLKIVYRMILDGVAALKFLLSGQVTHFFAVIKAHFSFYSWLPKIIRQRKELKSVPGFRYSTSQIYNGNVVWEYYIHGKKTYEQLKRNY